MTAVILIVFVYGVQAYITHSYPSNLMQTLAEWGVIWDSRRIEQVVLDERSAGREAYPIILPRNFLITPLNVNGEKIAPFAGIPHVQTVMCNEQGYYTSYVSDALGFNNPQFFCNQDVLILGDSYMLGECVWQNQNLAAHIRSIQPKTVTLGMQGIGPLTMFAMLKEYAPFGKPQKVVWSFYEGNDLQDLYWENNVPLLKRYVNEPSFTQGLVRQNSEITVALRKWMNQKLDKYRLESGEYGTAVIRQNLLLRDVRQAAKRAISGNIPKPLAGLTGREKERTPDGWGGAELKEILTLAKALIKSWGGELILLYVPEGDRFKNNTYANRTRDLVLATVKDLNIAVLDLVGIFRKHKDPLSLYSVVPVVGRGEIVGHLNAQGYAFAAEGLRSYIRGN